MIPRRAVNWALRVPLAYKIVVANTLIVVVVVVGGSAATDALVRSHPEHATARLVAIIAVLGAVLSLVANGLILRVALHPLREIEETARGVEAGAVDRRVPDSRLADRDLARLSRVMNGMLDRLAGYRSGLRHVAARAVHAAEEERKRISRELHDDAAQRLATLMLRLKLVMSSVEDEEARETLLEFREELATTADAIRGYARGLRPPALDDAGLWAAVEGLAIRARDAGLTVDLSGQPVPQGRLGEDEELAVYRMIQEALSNVLRHSGAERAEIDMRWNGDALDVVVRDEGRGFDVPRTVEDGSGLGLFGLGERADYLGGDVEVDSTPGRGTTVRIHVPRNGSGGGARAAGAGEHHGNAEEGR
jgi:two-component system sensor histidine kinase UhpB